MKARLAMTLAATLLVCSPAAADTDIVNETFDSFDDFPGDAAFRAAWVPTNGLGTADSTVTDVNSGIIVSNTGPWLDRGIQGKAVDHLGATASAPGMVNQWGGIIDQGNHGGGGAKNPVFNIAPSATQNIFLSADIYTDGTSANERMSVGLRHLVSTPDNTLQPPDADSLPDATTTNILELGLWNAAPTVLTYPGAPQVSTSYAWRVISWGASTGPPATPDNRQPNWQFFTLPPELNRATPVDTVVNPGDVGAGWHRYTATVSDTQLKLTIDLYRDGFRNLRNEAGEIVTGAAGVDAEVTLNIVDFNSLGFNSLRIGGPSGNSSAGTGLVGFDNVILKLVDIVVPTDDADFDGDGDVDGADLLAVQKGLGLTTGALPADGDANGDGDVDSDDLGVWKTQFGTGGTLGVTGAAGAVPEPASFALVATALCAAGAARRRRTR